MLSCDILRNLKKCDYCLYHTYALQEYIDKKSLAYAILTHIFHVFHGVVMKDFQKAKFKHDVTKKLIKISRKANQFISAIFHIFSKL